MEDGARSLIEDVVIVGCGRAGGLFDSPPPGETWGHASAYLRNKRFRLVACVDVDYKKAKEFSTKYKIPYVGTDLSSVLENVTPTVASITSPDDTHFSIAMQFLNGALPQPKVIFLEKPACASIVELETLIEFSKTANVPIIVNHCRRFDPLYIELKKRYKRGVFGDLLRVDCVYYGGWKHNAIHLVDIIEYLFAMEFREISVIEKLPGKIQSDPTITVKSSIGPKSLPVWFHGWQEDEYQIFDLEIRFSEGRLRITNFEEEIVWEKIVTNTIGERVLQRSDLCISRKESMANDAAVDVIGEYFNTGDKSVIKGYRLEDTRQSLEALWMADA